MSVLFGVVIAAAVLGTASARGGGDPPLFVVANFEKPGLTLGGTGAVRSG